MAIHKMLCCTLALLVLAVLWVPAACGIEPLQQSSGQSEDLSELRRRANSDDAKSVAECFAHSNARAQIILNLELNKLGVGGAEFRIKRNPVGDGCFVYDPRTRFDGVERLLMWYVSSDEQGYALNAPSKMLTPKLKWPREDAVNLPSTNEIAEYIFHAKFISTPSANIRKPTESSFTVEEYKIYRSVLDSPSSISESDVYIAVAKKHSIKASEAKAIVSHVQKTLFENQWFGSPSSEISHASDWNEFNR